MLKFQGKEIPSFALSAVGIQNFKDIEGSFIYLTLKTANSKMFAIRPAEDEEPVILFRCDRANESKLLKRFTNFIFEDSSEKYSIEEFVQSSAFWKNIKDTYGRTNNIFGLKSFEDIV